jgi:alpha-tubulin suppressor-like RCC1 family protein
MAAPLTNFQAGGEDLSDIYVDQTTVTTDGERLFPASAFSADGLAVVFNKSLWSWGAGNNGRLGLNSTNSRSSPVQVGSLTDWRLVAVGNGDNAGSSAGIKTGGTLWTWGARSYGQLGLNTIGGTNDGNSSPTQVGSLSDWASVSMGGRSSFAIKTDGTLWAWGRAGGTALNGVLGLSSLVNRSSPTQVGTLSDWARTESIVGRCFAIKTDGTLWSWGYNGTGRIGQNDTISRSSPVQIGLSNGWKMVTAGADHAHAIRNDGTLWGWGQPSSGQLGLNTTTPPRSSPAQVGTDTNWSDVSAGELSSVGVRTDGTMWTWGSGANGRLGLNTTTQRLSPSQVGTDTNWKSVQAGSVSCTAIKTDGTVWTWGFGGNGPHGVNSTINRSSPIQVGTDTNWKSISGRYFSVLARKA